MESLEIVAMGWERGAVEGNTRRGLVRVMVSHPTRVATQTRNIEVVKGGTKSQYGQREREPRENYIIKELQKKKKSCTFRLTQRAGREGRVRRRRRRNGGRLVSSLSFTLYMADVCFLFQMFNFC